MKTRNRTTVLMVFIVCFMFISSAVSSAIVQQKSVSATNDSIKKYINTYRIEDGDWSVNGKVYEGHAMYMTFFNKFDVQMNVKGFDTFTGYLAIPDNEKYAEGSSIVIKVDEQEVKQVVQHRGDDATFIDIPVTGKNTLRITMTQGGYIHVINPMLQVGGSSPSSPVSANPDRGSHPNLVAAPSAVTAPFIVDPNDLDKLASALRKRVDANPDMKSRLDKGNIALMTFELISIESKTVSKDVAENLSTSMINSGFSLVERGQLDKAVQELKLQETALINPTTAQRLGQMTGCNFIVVGSISDQDTFLVINSRILETATGKAVAAERVELRKIKRN